MTAANIGNWKILVGTNASPEVLTEIEEVLDADGFGEDAPLIEVTNWDTAVGQKEFIAGNAEGEEFTVTCNFISGTGTHQRALRADKGATRPFEARYAGTSPQQVWSGSCVIKSWAMVPSNDEQSQMEFTFKITGALSEAGGA